MIEAKVSGLAFDQASNVPVVFLKEADGDCILPIWIGLNEASSIAIALTHMHIQRPLTHDLIKSVITGLDATIVKVVVNDIRDSTYYARIYLKHANSIIEIDARPSDSIAIALRSDAPIYISDSVLERGSTFSLKEGDTLRAHFQELKPEDFGKFEL